jgi:hypothetical protein
MKTLGQATLKIGDWRFQCYWPPVTLRFGPQSEFFIDMATCVRFVIDRRRGFYVGAGFNLLGFGIGGDYFRPSEANKPQTLTESEA